jgi:hypothetical protein
MVFDDDHVNTIQADHSTPHIDRKVIGIGVFTDWHYSITTTTFIAENLLYCGIQVSLKILQRER